MKNVVSRTICTAACFCLCIGFLLISVDFVALNKSFYLNEFHANDSAETVGISDADLNAVTTQLIKYLSGQSNTIQVNVTFYGSSKATVFYGTDELDHMRDAKTVFVAARILGYTLFGVGAVVLIVLAILMRKKFVKPFAFGAAVGSAIFLCIGIILGIIIAADFNGAFVAFHKIFFPKGNWEFPESSAMIRMLPESLFTNAAAIILASAAVFSVLLCGIGTFFLIRNRNKKVTV